MFTKEKQWAVLAAYDLGEKVSDIANELGMAQTTIYRWIKKEENGDLK